MSKMSILVLEIMEDLEAQILSFQAIASKHNVPLEFVKQVEYDYDYAPGY